MKQLAEDRARLPGALNLLYAPISEELDRVEEILRRELRSEYPFVDRLAKHGFRLGGKRLRPALVLLSAKASGELGRRRQGNHRRLRRLPPTPSREPSSTRLRCQRPTAAVS